MRCIWLSILTIVLTRMNLLQVTLKIWITKQYGSHLIHLLELEEDINFSEHFQQKTKQNSVCWFLVRGSVMIYVLYIQPNGEKVGRSV